MAAKTTNVLIRAEPDIIKLAEAIMAQRGLPASVVSNTLYQQIAMTKSIPSSLSVPNGFQMLDEMNHEEVHLMMRNGLDDAKKGNSRSVKSVFDDLRQEIAEILSCNF